MKRHCFVRFIFLSFSHFVSALQCFMLAGLHFSFFLTPSQLFHHSIPAPVTVRWCDCESQGKVRMRGGRGNDAKWKCEWPRRQVCVSSATVGVCGGWWSVWLWWHWRDSESLLFSSLFCFHFSSSVTCFLLFPLSFLLKIRILSMKNTVILWIQYESFNYK